MMNLSTHAPYLETRRTITPNGAIGYHSPHSLNAKQKDYSSVCSAKKNKAHSLLGTFKVNELSRRNSNLSRKL